MTPTSRRSFVLTAAGTALLAGAWPMLAGAQAGAGAARNRVVFSVSDNDPARWNLVLNNVANLRDGVGSEGVDIEVVTYGPGILMLKADSAVKQRVAEALKNGARLSVCQNTMAFMKFSPADMLPDVSYVPAGVVEVVKKQQQGWAYVRP